MSTLLIHLKGEIALCNVATWLIWSAINDHCAKNYAPSTMGDLLVKLKIAKRDNCRVAWATSRLHIETDCGMKLLKFWLLTQILCIIATHRLKPPKGLREQWRNSCLDRKNIHGEIEKNASWEDQRICETETTRRSALQFCFRCSPLPHWRSINVSSFVAVRKEKAGREPQTMPKTLTTEMAKVETGTTSWWWNCILNLRRHCIDEESLSQLLRFGRRFVDEYFYSKYSSTRKFFLFC